jgi:hypothetical protein
MESEFQLALLLEIIVPRRVDPPLYTTMFCLVIAGVVIHFMIANFNHQLLSLHELVRETSQVCLLRRSYSSLFSR